MKKSKIQLKLRRFSKFRECKLLFFSVPDPACITLLDPNIRHACLASMVLYEFIGGLNKCQSFVYGGCGRKSNKFSTQFECEERCVKTNGMMASNSTSTFKLILDD